MNSNFYRHLAEFISSSVPAWVVTVVSVDGSSPASEGMKLLIPETGEETYGTIGGGEIEFQIINKVRESKPFQPETIKFDLGGGNSNDMICGGFATVMIEPLNQHPELFIYGAGHCAIALSFLAAKCGFKVTVADSRMEWANAEKHPEASECKVTEYSDAETLIKHPQKSYVVIMTFGHQFDEIVLERLVELPLKYLGMMGSEGKVKEVYDNLITKGYNKELFEKVNAPIGLDIGSRTPWEIAVSITGELIKIRKEK